MPFLNGISRSDAKSGKVSSKESIRLEKAHSAHNYHPLPIVFAKAQGAYVWDPEGRQYLDFLSAYSAVNQGHCHPKIISALVEQAQNLTLSSRAFHNNVYGTFSKYVTEYFGYDRVLPMNTGAEAVETSIKIARKWGYMKKGIARDQAIVLTPTENFHGRTMGVISMSTDPESRDGYGPYLPNVGPQCPASESYIRYNCIEDLEEAFSKHGRNVAAFLVEPIQGEAGIVVPDDTYLRRVSSLCKEHDVLLIADEIQTGIARTGKMLCVDHSGVRPDMVLLGKAISGGVYPVSVVLADDEIMNCIEPGTHGSTYGGNPLGCAVSMAALDVVREENLVQRAATLGEMFRAGLKEFQSPLIKVVRGLGLLNAIVIDESLMNGKTAWELCLLMKSKGLLAKPTHQNIIRFAPPLVISEEDVRKGLSIIKASLEEVASLNISQIVGDSVHEHAFVQKNDE